MKEILSNLGFVMQLSGLLMLIPIGVASYYNEMVPIIALLVTALLFLGLGFMMNALCERRELTFKGSSTLFVFAFVLLSLFGAVPFYFLNVTDAVGIVRVTDSIFESASGFTTTGFSLITDYSVIPKSIIFYRGIIQFIGGLGIVLILLAFFYPNEKLDKFAKQMGLQQTQKIKQVFVAIFGIYVIYCVGMIGIAYLLGYTDLTITSSLFFSAVSTGGFSTSADMSGMFHGTWLGILVMITMLLGASNFIAVAGLLKFKFKEFFRSEVPVYLLFIGLVIGFLFFVLKSSGYDLFATAFHTVSTMTNAGFSYMGLGELSTGVKVFLSILMFIGGTSLSTAGGIKIVRLFVIIFATHKTVKDTLTERSSVLHVFGRDYTDGEIVQVFVTVMLMSFVLLAGTMIFNSYGYSLTDSLFEVSSGLSNTGLSVGVLTAASALSLKWVMIAIMIIGRVEVFSFLIMLYFYRTPSVQEQLTTL